MHTDALVEQEQNSPESSLMVQYFILLVSQTVG